MKGSFYTIITWRAKSPLILHRVILKVIESMTGNESFPDPAVSMKELTAASDRLNTAINNRGNGKAATLELKAASEEVDTLLRTQATYVTQASEGDDMVINSSGFTSNKGTDSKSVVPAMPTAMKIRSKDGNIHLSAKKPKGATSLCWSLFINTDPVEVTVTNKMISIPPNTAGVIIIPTGRANEVLDGLPIGTKVTAQVLAQNPAGKSPLCAPDFCNCEQISLPFAEGG